MNVFPRKVLKIRRSAFFGTPGIVGPFGSWSGPNQVWGTLLEKKWFFGCPTGGTFKGSLNGSK